AGDGTLRIAAGCNYTGGTTVNAGTLVVPQGGGAAGAIRGALSITNATVICSLNWGLGYGSGTCVSDITITSGTLNFTNSINGGGTSATNITMTAGLINGDSFSLYNGISSTPKITSLASASSSVISNGFNLRLNTNNVTLTVAAGTVPDGTDLLVSGPITSYFNGSSKDGITKAGDGKLLLTANNAYQGTTLILGGTLQVGSGGTAGTLGAGAVTNNAALVYNRSDSCTVSNSISGTGTLTQSGSGTLVLSGTNTYAGATVVSNGILRLTHAQCLSTNTAVSISSGAKIDLAFTGVNTVRSLTVDGVLQVRNKVYGTYNLPEALSGNNDGFLRTIEGAPPKGTLILIY
ncbi:MAG: autotransporter-associated beta strand repeat-containing protein, partial [bacterium]